MTIKSLLSQNESQIFDELRKTQDDSFTKIKYKDGSVYKGSIKNGKKHGKGLLIDPSGDIYEGEFSNDDI